MDILLSYIGAILILIGMLIFLVTLVKKSIRRPVVVLSGVGLLGAGLLFLILGYLMA